MSTNASVVQFVENGETVLAEVDAVSMPHQTDWVNINGEAYKVYDVVHTVYPELERMVSSVFVWSPDPEATDSTIDRLRDNAIAARAGEWEPDQPEFGDAGDAVKLIHDRETLTQVTVSALPAAHGMKYEGLVLPGVEETFAVSSLGVSVEENESEMGIFLADVEDAKTGAQMADVGRNLYGQRENARTRVLDHEGDDAYEEMMERIESQGN